jgi:hypothetical protein
MALKFEKNTEAFLAVLTLVVGADKVGSLAERDFLFEKVKGIAIFENPSSADFSRLLGQVTDAVYSNLPQQDGAITDAGVDTLLALVGKTLSTELKKTLVQTAGALVRSDGADAAELQVLEKIQRAFG